MGDHPLSICAVAHRTHDLLRFDPALSPPLSIAPTLWSAGPLMLDTEQTCLHEEENDHRGDVFFLTHQRSDIAKQVKPPNLADYVRLGKRHDHVGIRSDGPDQKHSG